VVDQRGWTIPCIDAVGRPRWLTVRVYAAGVVLGFPPAGSATIPPHRTRALAMTLAGIDETTVGVSGGESATGLSRVGLSRPRSNPVAPETAMAPGGAPVAGPTALEPTVGAADARFAAPTVGSTR
jgi:hypothetical protein